MVRARRGRLAKLEVVPGRIFALPAVRHLETSARAATGSPAGRRRNCGGRCDGRRVCGTCLIHSGMVQSLLTMAIRKTSNGRPQIIQVTPPAAIAGGELQIKGKGFAKADRPRVTIGDVSAPVVIGSDSFVIVKVPEGASAGDLVIESGEQSSQIWTCDIGIPIAD